MGVRSRGRFNLRQGSGSQVKPPQFAVPVTLPPDLLEVGTQAAGLARGLKPDQGLVPVGQTARAITAGITGTVSIVQQNAGPHGSAQPRIRSVFNPTCCDQMRLVANMSLRGKKVALLFLSWAKISLSGCSLKRTSLTSRLPQPPLWETGDMANKQGP
jgi:hypothetical protein